MVWNICYFHPFLGKVSNLTNIFQLGWNHQLDLFVRLLWSPLVTENCSQVRRCFGWFLATGFHLHLIHNKQTPVRFREILGAAPYECVIVVGSVLLIHIYILGIPSKRPGFHENHFCYMFQRIKSPVQRCWETCCSCHPWQRTPQAADGKQQMCLKLCMQNMNMK